MAVLRRGWAAMERFSANPMNQMLVNIVLGLAIAGLATAFFLFSLQTHRALCNFRADLEKRVAGTDKFLRANPHLKAFKIGPVLVTRGQLVKQAKSQHATLKSLNDLNC